MKNAMQMLKERHFPNETRQMRVRVAGRVESRILSKDVPEYQRFRKTNEHQQKLIQVSNKMKRIVL